MDQIFVGELEGRSFNGKQRKVLKRSFGKVILQLSELLLINFVTFVNVKYLIICNLFKGRLKVFKKAALISGIVFSSIVLVGCNGEEVIDISENGESVAILLPANIFLSELQDKITVAITEQTAIKTDSIMLDGHFKELSVSVGFL